MAVCASVHAGDAPGASRWPCLAVARAADARSAGVVRRYRRARRIPGSEHQRRQYLAAQTLTVNGSVPAQATPAPDTWQPTVTATVYLRSRHRACHACSAGGGGVPAARRVRRARPRCRFPGHGRHGAQQPAASRCATRTRCRSMVRRGFSGNSATATTCCCPPTRSRSARHHQVPPRRTAGVAGARRGNRWRSRRATGWSSTIGSVHAGGQWRAAALFGAGVRGRGHARAASGTELEGGARGQGMGASLQYRHRYAQAGQPAGAGWRQARGRGRRAGLGAGPAPAAVAHPAAGAGPRAYQGPDQWRHDLGGAPDWPRAGLGGRRRARGMQPMAVCASYTRATRLEHRAGLCAGGAGGGRPIAGVVRRYRRATYSGASTAPIPRNCCGSAMRSCRLARMLRLVGIDVPADAAGSPALRLLRACVQLQRDAVGEPDGAGRLAHALSTRHTARHPQGAAGHQRARAGAELRRYAHTAAVPGAAYRERYFSRGQQTPASCLCRRAADRYILLDAHQDTMHAAAGRHDHAVAGLVASIRIACSGAATRCGQTPVTFPVAISASSVVPSSIALYINGCSTPATCRPAPWSTRFGITGAGQATIVTRDALGRSIATTVPLPWTRAAGAGPVQLFGGVASAVQRAFVRLRPRAGFSASGRYGSDDALTLEGHAESAPGVTTGSGRAGQAGRGGRGQRLLAGSAGRYAGGQTSLGYQCGLSSAWTVVHPALGDDGDLGSREDAPVVRQTRDRVVSHHPVAEHGLEPSAIASWTRRPPSWARRLYTVNCSRVAMNLSAFHDFNQSDSNGVYLSLTLMMGDRGLRRSAASRTATAWARSVRWTMKAARAGRCSGRSGGQAYTQGQAQYLGRHGADRSGAGPGRTHRRRPRPRERWC